MMPSSIHFGWVDYLLFSLMLAVSSCVGIYHARRGAGDSTTNYLFGGKTMGVFPVAMSLAASFVSNTVMLGLPTDIYMTGAMYSWNVVNAFIGVLIASYVYMPVFYELQLVSVNQYLEMRFHRLVRRVSSFITLTQLIMYLGILSYAPSLALTQVTGIDVYVCCGITLLVCTFYTTLGGMKAVVWTDTIQIFLMIGSVAALVIKGIADVGFENVWQRNINSGRLEFFNIDPDPTTRYTIWSILIGGSFITTSYFGTGQGFVQRFMSIPTKRKAQLAVLINIVVVVVFTLLCCASGLVAYAKYFECDPLQAKLINKADQIIPYFVMDTFRSIPGLPGLYVAGVFSAALSSLSTFLNASALIILEDFVRPFHPNLSEKLATKITKFVSVVFGCLGFGFVFAFSNVKTILDATSSVSGAGFGASLGIFTLGMLFPWANSIGAGVGIAASYACLITLGMLLQVAKSLGLIHDIQIKPVSIDNCPFSLNLTEPFSHVDDEPKEEAFFLLRISFLWYCLLGTSIVLIVGILISLLTGPQDPGQLDPRLVFHFMKHRVGHKRVEIIAKEGEKNEEKEDESVL